MRMFLVGSAEPWQDFDWRNELVSSTRKQIERFFNTVSESMQPENEANELDRWLLSRLQAHITRTTESLERFQTRQALQEAFFGIESDLKWYRRRLGENVSGGQAIRDLCSAWVRLLAPVIPFTCEQLWKDLGGEGLVSFAPWPVPEEEAVAPVLELAEELLLRTVEDIESIKKIIQMEPASITIYIAPGWKQKIFNLVAGSEDRNLAIKEVMKDQELKSRGKETADTTRACVTLVHRLPPQLVERILAGAPDEMAIFRGAQKFLEAEFGIPVEVALAEESGHAKAASALPFKPAIVME
jgi:leucyl-tRNA synthetase